jgi:uncharacterized protein
MPDSAATLVVRAYPRAARDAVGPLRDGVLQVRVTRPAAGGEANDAIRRLLAEALGTAPSRVELVSGARSRQKRFAIHEMNPAELAGRLRTLWGGD